jgi:GNAT superfamily N-acetyltransferase
MTPVPNFTIEEFGPDDWNRVAPQVLALYRELGDEAEDLGELDDRRVRDAWQARPELMRVFAALDAAGNVLGLMTLTEGFAIYANGRFGIIPEMFVRSDARSFGIGAALIATARGVGVERGWSRIEVTGPEAGTERTIAFYRRNGFTAAGPKLKLAL